MDRPFTLTPCGHTACYSCLISWFKAKDPADNADGPNRLPDVMILSSPPPAGPPSRATCYRKKTCPHCRAELTQRPIEVWSLKDAVAALLKSGLAEEDLVPAPSTNVPAAEPKSDSDPWDGIFHNPSAMADHIQSRERRGIQDNEDGGVFRCVDCAHEIWAGECTGCHRIYPGHNLIDLILDDSDFHGYSSGSDDEDSDHNQMERRARRRRSQPVQEIDEVEEDYEGSFIDDGSGNEDSNQIRVLDLSSTGELDSDIEIVSASSSPRRPLPVRSSRPRRAAYIDISSADEAFDEAEDEDEDEDIIARRVPMRIRSRIIDIDEQDGPLELLDSDEESHEDGRSSHLSLAERVAALERAQYGDDGSVPSRAGRRRYEPLSDSDDLMDLPSDEDEMND